MRKWSQFLFTIGRRRLPLADAMQFVQASHEIVRRHSLDHHIPDESDLILLAKLINETQDLRLTAMKTYHLFTQRIKDASSHTHV